MRIFKHNSNRQFPSYQNTEIWMINDAFDMFVNRGDGILSKLILIILSFFHPKDNRKSIAIYLQELIGLMYPKYKKNYASRYKKNVINALKNESNFVIEIKGKKKRLFTSIFLYKDGLLLINCDYKFINRILYIEDRPLDEKNGFFKIDVNKLNKFNTINKYIPIWLYILQLTNNGMSLSGFTIWKTTLFPKLGIYTKINFIEFNYKVFKPAMKYIVEIDKDKECKVDEIEARTKGDNQLIKLSVKVPEIKEEKSKEEKQETDKKEAPECFKKFYKAIK